VESVEDDGLDAVVLGSWLAENPLVSLDERSDVSSRRNESDDGEEGRERLPHRLIDVRLPLSIVQLKKRGCDGLRGGIQELSEESCDDRIEMKIHDVLEHRSFSESWDTPRERLNDLRVVDSSVVEDGGETDGERPRKAFLTSFLLRSLGESTDLGDAILSSISADEQEIHAAESTEKHVCVLFRSLVSEERRRDLGILVATGGILDESSDDGRRVGFPELEERLESDRRGGCIQAGLKMDEARLGNPVHPFEDVPVRLLSKRRRDDEDVGPEEGSCEAVFDSDACTKFVLTGSVVIDGLLDERIDEIVEVWVDDGCFEANEDVEIPGDGRDESDERSNLFSLLRRGSRLPELLRWIRSKVRLDEPEELDSNARRPHLPCVELLREQ